MRILNYDISSCGGEIQSHRVEVAGERSHSDASLPSQVRVVQPSETAFENSKLTRRYQTIFLICAFLMIFQVMRLISVYGVFQEYFTSSETNITDAL
ncbi:hypothetical protein ACEPAF_7543 [Sanghuangporus sanghuang]